MNRANRIENQMTEYPFIADANLSVTEAHDAMEGFGFRHLPVLDGEKIIGVVSDRDLRQALALKDKATLFVKDVMSPNPYCATVGTSLRSVAKEMVKHKYGCAVIVNEWNRVVGIFTTTDAMKVLCDLLESEPTQDYKFLGVERVISSDCL